MNAYWVVIFLCVIVQADEHSFEDSESKPVCQYLEGLVDLFSGQLQVEAADIELDCKVPISFVRKYTSARPERTDWSIGLPADIPNNYGVPAGIDRECEGTRIESNGDVSISDKSGKVRYFKKQDKKRFLLIRERLSDGNWIGYEYDNGYRLAKILSMNPDRTKVYGTISVRYQLFPTSKQIQFCEVISSEGHKLHYQFREEKKRKSSLLRVVSGLPGQGEERLGM